MRLWLLLLLCLPALAQDPRYCGPPPRDAQGQIIRSSAVRSAFQKLWPCPSTGLPAGACPGWSRDHILPMVCGGCDSIANMAWMPNAIKSAAGDLPKDRWEQKVYCRPQQLVVFP